MAATVGNIRRRYSDRNNNTIRDRRSRGVREDRAIEESSSDDDNNENATEEENYDEDVLSQRSEIVSAVEGPRFVVHGPFYFRLSVAGVSTTDDVSRFANVISSDFADVSENDRNDRRASYLSSLWEDAAKPRMLDMVDAGFIYTGSYDGTYCFMCEVMIHGWSVNDDPFVRHVANSPGCGFAFRAYLERSLRRFVDDGAVAEKKSIGVQTTDPSPRPRPPPPPTPPPPPPPPTPPPPPPPSSSSHQVDRPLINFFADEESTIRKKKQQSGQRGVGVFVTEDLPIYLRSDMLVERAKNERYHEMNERFRSFLHCSDLRLLPSPLGLANSGFYYVGPSDELRCVSCYRTFVNWSPFDSPWQVHAKLSPNCPFVATDSRVFGRSTAMKSTPRTRTTNEVKNAEVTKIMNNGGGGGYVWNTENVTTNTNFENWRIDSFLPWATEFAKAGFFLVENGSIECYACGGRLNNMYELFADKSSPDEMHEFWFPKCPLVLHRRRSRRHRNNNDDDDDDDDELQQSLLSPSRPKTPAV